MLKSSIIKLCLLVILTACSGISLINQSFEYDAEFMKRFEGIQSIYKDGDKSGAIARLNKFRSEKLTDAERAKVLNQLGIYYYNQSEFVKAQEHFEDARGYVKEDKELDAEIHLNLASTYFKLDMRESAFNVINAAKPKFLKKNVRETFFKLKLLLAQDQENDKAVIDSLIYLLAEKENFNEIKGSNYKELLIDYFRKLTPSERAYILDSKEKESLVVIAYLGTEEAMQRYYFGDRQGANDVVDWLDKNYSDLKDVQRFIDDFRFRSENFAKIDGGSVGVVLPLSGRKGRFGTSALKGLDAAINYDKNKTNNIKVYTRDNRDNPVVAKKVIHDLIQKHHVSIIIGGLFSNTALHEYLEAKKYGVLYISLTAINLPRDEKNHLLIEVPGSIQSQLDKLISEDFLQAFGKRVAMFYPDDNRGKTYLEEMWKHHKSGKINITSLYSYDHDPKVKDYREWVEKLLGLKYKKERKEELELWKEIYSLEKSSSTIRRIQTLKPVIDFDWVFVPSYPHQAQQFLPTFSYFDARNLTYIGDQSWMVSRKFLNLPNKESWGKLLLVGDDTRKIDKNYFDIYKSRNNSNPSFIETFAFEAMRLSLNVLKDSKFEQREDLERKIVNLQKLEGITGKWNLKEGIWIKELDLLRIIRDDVRKVVIEDQSKNEQEAQKQ
tara:strand:- start:16330 stop:18324 length:1995 start_codon:yes stop_codon:yes gene_type:complete